MDLFVVRHGRTEANAAGVLLGRSDPGLDPVGCRQAEEIAVCLNGMERVISSPLRRALETARALGVEPEVDERLIEIDYGTYDLMPLTSIPSEIWRRWASDPDFTPGGGESISDMGVRVSGFLSALSREPDQGNIAIVTHVSPIKVALAWALGVGVEISWRAQVSQASITRIRSDGKQISLHEFNNTSHLS